MKRANIAIALLLIFLITGCTTPTGNVIAEDTIEIGVLAILSGPGTTWGQSTVNGAQIAVNELNANGGINNKQIALVIEDTKADSTTTLTAYTKLRNIDEIQYIIGTSWSSQAMPIIPLAKEDDVVIISPSLGVATFNEAANNLFNVWPHDAQLSAKMAELVFSKGHQKVAVFSTQDVWVTTQSDAFVERFKELGGDIVLVNPPQEDRSLQTEISRIKLANVDAVMITNTITGDVAARRLQELGVQKPLYSITMGADTITASNGAMNGLVFLSSLTPSEEFVQKYEQTYPNQILDVGADTGYDAVMLFAQAMQETKSEDPKVIAQYLNSLSRYEGASGSLQFDGRGGVTKDFVQFTVEDGVAKRS